MRHAHRFTLVAGTAIATVGLLCGAAAGAAPSERAAAASGGAAAPSGGGGTTPAEVRVNQVGYPAGSPKVAFAMLPGQVGQVGFTVSAGAGWCSAAAPAP